ncbi:MAG: LysR family transcriptional regulator [Bacteroidota bacterium]
MAINLDVGELEAFVALTERLNFKAAAEALFISQPALSRRIEKLESRLQTRLLERTTRRVSLTETGQHFLRHARIVIEELELAVVGMTERTRRRREVVTVACVPSVANHMLPIMLTRLAAKFPAASVKVIDESAKDVLEAVVKGVADFGVNFIGTQEADIEFKPIHKERYALVVRCEHRLAKRQSVTWPDITSERLVSVSRASGNRMLIDNALAKVANRPAIQYEANHVAGALAMVTAGLGVGVLPELALQLAHPALVSIPLLDPTITRTLGLITRKGSRLTPAAQALFDLLDRMSFGA